MTGENALFLKKKNTKNPWLISYICKPLSVKCCRAVVSSSMMIITVKEGWDLFLILSLCSTYLSAAEIPSHETHLEDKNDWQKIHFYFWSFFVSWWHPGMILFFLWMSILVKEIMLCFVYLSFVVATHKNSVREVHLLCGGNPMYQPLPAYDPALCLAYPQLCFQHEFAHNNMPCLYTRNHRCVFVHIFRKNFSGHPNTPSSFSFESSSPWPWSRPAACSSCWFQREPIEPPSCGLLISPRVTQELICSVGRNKIPSRHAFIPTIQT